jgi:hypothetical protein
MVLSAAMRLPDLDRERSEKSLSLNEFLRSYNEGLPLEFPRASLTLLREFRMAHTTLFKNNNSWSLDQHRKVVMNWLPSRCRATNIEG